MRLVVGGISRQAQSAAISRGSRTSCGFIGWRDLLTRDGGIRAHADGVRLYLTTGKELPDPEKILQGTANARWIAVEGASTLARPAVARLIDEAIARNRVPFARAGAGSVIVRSTAIKKRQGGRST